MFSAAHNVWTWLKHGEPSDAKHLGVLHPTLVCILHYAVVTTVSFQAHDFLLPYHNINDCSQEQQKSTQYYYSAALFLMVYATWLILWRLFYTTISSGSTSQVIYQYCWLCNVTLWQAALALFTHRPTLATAYAVTVGIDQLLWYVDVGWVLLGNNKFPIGVAAFLVWPENRCWTRRITCTHHFWTLPLIMGVVQAQWQQYPTLVWILSAVAMLVNVTLCRWLIPCRIMVVVDGESKKNNHYLNVNLSHELWKDIRISWLQISKDDPGPTLYMFRLLWRWQGFNTVVFGLLYGVSWCLFPPGSILC